MYIAARLKDATPLQESHVRSVHITLLRSEEGLIKLARL
jgi:hypothetical protein